jgi:hypothetical protein
MQVITRADAHAQGLMHFYNGKPCQRGHVAQRFVSTGGCVECGKFYGKKYAADKRRANYQNFDQKRAELLPADIHVPVQHHNTVYALIDYLLAQEGRPPCGYPKPEVTPPPAIDMRTPYEKMWDLQARFGRYKTEMLCKQIPETHSPGWVPAPLANEPTAPPAHLGGNKPDYL